MNVDEWIERKKKAIGGGKFGDYIVDSGRAELLTESKWQEQVQAHCNQIFGSPTGSHCDSLACLLEIALSNTRF